MKVTPLRRQYLKVKQKYPETIVFFRLGDFYETFDEDARVTSRELDIVLTSREMGKGQKVPLAGIPHHAVDNYLARLINRGYKVAICEQLSPPGKGLVERDVIRVVTPGTVVETNLLESRSNNYLVSVIVEGEQAGIAYVDITTSEFAVAQLGREKLVLELDRLQPRELLMSDGDVYSIEEIPADESLNTSISKLDPYYYDLEIAGATLRTHFDVIELESYGCAHLPLAISAAGALIHYVSETQKEALSQLTSLRTYTTEAYMTIDGQTSRNLEITKGGRWGESKNSLLNVLDQTRTAMAARLLKSWLGQPLISIEAIEQRLNVVEWFYKNTSIRDEIRTLLKDIADLERIINRTRSGKVLPRELISLKVGLQKVPELQSYLDDLSLAWLKEELKTPLEVIGLLDRAIKDEPGTLEQGEVIKFGFSSELDEIRDKAKNTRQYLIEIEQREKERTGIKSLKVRYNRVFGYYIEISRANLEFVPSDYIRKQTLTGSERFYTPELKEYESVILNAQEKMLEMETSIFQQICSQISTAAEMILTAAQSIAVVDTLCSFAEVAVSNNYTKPEIISDNIIRIKNGRHPTVERSLGIDKFVPNDTFLDEKNDQVVILTGPNMSGKSTYLRQVALIVFMAHIGSYVPAEMATIGLTDRIFTRIGAQEDLAAGQSTFMVEMTETANILHHATSRSLVILDEIGRGTSTYDGLSIAWAVTEYIHNNPALGAKTLFATHYHELVALDSILPRIKNYTISAIEEKGKVLFLHKIIPGGADRSYGIHVAKLAGLPRSVVNRAWEILSWLETDHTSDHKIPVEKKQKNIETQLSFIHEESVVEKELQKMDIDSLSPLEAITKLYELKKLISSETSKNK
jgi:DNA mismatch repair protein MutS